MVWLHLHISLEPYYSPGHEAGGCKYGSIAVIGAADAASSGATDAGSTHASAACFPAAGSSSGTLDSPSLASGSESSEMIPLDHLYPDLIDWLR